MFRLSDRLQAVYDFVIDGNVVADIGTDHGYLPIALVCGGKSAFAYACDLRKGPLSRAEEHIRQVGVSDRVKTVLSDGMAGLSKNMADTITITGMGGRLIKDIMIKGRPVYDDKTQLIVSPQSEIGEFRLFMASEGYEIVREHMLMEDGKYYVIIDCRYTGKPYDDKFTKEQLLFGDYLLKGKDKVLYEYLCNEKKVRLFIIDQFAQNAPGEGVSDRKQVLMDELTIINKALEYYSI
ncbi:MAG: tRNA (adenine(22)-N(1))-methyltransferase [Lachnospira sp.]